MLLKSSLEEAYSVFQSFMKSSLDDICSSASSVVLNPVHLSQTLHKGSRVEDQKSLITPAPRLSLRNPTPQDGGDCAAQAAQSASQAIQQASQSASESIRQASQSASQAVQQASNSASQSIAAASRSMSALSSSASSAISRALSAQSEASLAISRARVVLATGTGTAGAVASANRPATASQNIGVTPTQAALAIVGSIIASTLITITIVYLFSRYKKNKAATKISRSQASSSPAQSPKYHQDPKFTFTDQNGTTIAGSQVSRSRGKDARRQDSDASLYTFPRNQSLEKSPGDFPAIKSTSVPWNPAQPPKVPNLSDWLKEQDAMSPFGPIKLPIDESPKGPLGGQLKSPLQGSRPTGTKPKYSNDLPLRSGATAVPLKVERVTIRPVQNLSSNRKSTVKNTKVPVPNLPSPLAKEYEASKSTVWTDSPPAMSSRDLNSRGPAPKLRGPPRRNSSTRDEGRGKPQEFVTAETTRNDVTLSTSRRPGLPMKPWPSSQDEAIGKDGGDGGNSRGHRLSNRLSSYLGAASRRGQPESDEVGTAV